MLRRTQLPVVAMLLALLLGCSVGQAPERAGAPEFEEVRWAWWAPEGDGNVSDAAALTGTLEVRDGCLVVMSASRKEYVLPVFPDFASLDPASGILSMRDKTFELGSEVLLGGGYVETRYDENFEGCESAARLWFRVGVLQ